MDGTYSNVGAVVGATYPEMSRILRKLMPHTYFLVPGYGAQGGTAADLKHCFNETDWEPSSIPPGGSLPLTSRRSTPSSDRSILPRRRDRQCWT